MSMKVYVEAQSKAALIRRLSAGEEISGYNYSMFGGGGQYMLDDNLEDGTIIAIYSQMSQGNPVAKSWGTWTNGVLKAETLGGSGSGLCSVCGSEAVHYYKNGEIQLCDKHYQQQFGRYSAETFEATNLRSRKETEKRFGKDLAKYVHTVSMGAKVKPSHFCECGNELTIYPVWNVAESHKLGKESLKAECQKCGWKGVVQRAAGKYSAEDTKSHCEKKLEMAEEMLQNSSDFWSAYCEDLHDEDLCYADCHVCDDEWLESHAESFEAHSYRGYSYERPLGMKVLGVGVVVALGLGLLGLGAANE